MQRRATIAIITIVTVSDCCNKEAWFSAEEDIAIITIVTVGHSLELRQLTGKITHFFTVHTS